MSYQSKYIIYSLEKCFYSTKAENYLIQYGFPHQIIRVSRADKDKYKQFLEKETFPQIYYQDCYNRRYSLGGCSEFEEFIKKRIIK